MTGSITGWIDLRLLPVVTLFARIGPVIRWIYMRAKLPHPRSRGAHCESTSGAMERRPRCVMFSPGAPPPLHSIRHGGAADQDRRHHWSEASIVCQSAATEGLPQRRLMTRLRVERKKEGSRTKANEDEEGGPPRTTRRP